MDYLPKDPAILVSSVNMLLRDEDFDTFGSIVLQLWDGAKRYKKITYTDMDLFIAKSRSNSVR